MLSIVCCVYVLKPYISIIFVQDKNLDEIRYFENISSVCCEFVVGQTCNDALKRKKAR